MTKNNLPLEGVAQPISVPASPVSSSYSDSLSAASNACDNSLATKNLIDIGSKENETRALTIPVFFDLRMCALDNQPSPSARKPKLLVEAWQKTASPIHIEPVVPIETEDFYLSHDKKHVDDILSLEKPNGMETKSKPLSDSLAWTTGSMLCAARYVLQNKHKENKNQSESEINNTNKINKKLETSPPGLKVAVSPTSCFHHAEYDAAMGYCTFNGLMITTQKLLSEALVSRVGILDCDQHYGNGTDDIIRHFKLQDCVVHITSEKDYKPWPRYRDMFFRQLPEFLSSLKDCDIILYQAGADCHINDPHGGFLSSSDMRLRDHMVFSFCAQNGIPLVWNLAGGYQEEKRSYASVSIDKVLALHTATLHECAKVYLR